MLPRNHPDRIQITFDDRRLVANAGLLLPATLARHLGLPELVRQRLDLGDAPGRANTSDKMMTLVASALAGGDCIDDADVLRTGGTASTLGGTVTCAGPGKWDRAMMIERLREDSEYIELVGQFLEGCKLAKSATPRPTIPAGVGHGAYEVGVDIQPGRYRSAGPEEPFPMCSFARLKTAGASYLDFDEVIDIQNVMGPAIVNIKPTDGGVFTQGCQPWTRGE